MPAGEILPLDLGGGLVLTATTGADADEAFDVIDAERSRLREWLPWVDGTTEVATEREFFGALAQANATGAGLHTTIRQDGEFFGVAGLRINVVRRSGEVGYWLAARAVGQGVMARTVAALFDAGFTQLGLHRLELLAALGNGRSRAVAERLGMVIEGVRREAEELPSGFVDLAMYSMLAQDWPGSAAALQRARVYGG